MFHVNKSKSIVSELLKDFNPHQYAKTRNSIEGQVSHLSPYITHGVVTLPEVYSFVNSKFRLNAENKFLKELTWREFFYHVWSFKKNQIFQPIKEEFRREKYNSSELPKDIVNGSTGLNLIDNSVKQLYEFGYLHNHARMWLASYIVHFRKVDWRIGADWLYSHLLDGDLASNHLSWQWVAGSFSSKPYLFNAHNVSKYAPDSWNCYGTFLDDSYENLYQFANSSEKVEGGVVKKEIQPEIYSSPIEDLPNVTTELLNDVYIIHPWNIRKCSNSKKINRKKVGVFFEDFHKKWPWSKKRWNFVMEHMKSICDEIYWCKDYEVISNVYTEENLHLDFVTTNNKNKIILEKKPNIWSEQNNYCQSFSKFWKKINSKKNNQYRLFS